MSALPARREREGGELDDDQGSQTSSRSRQSIRLTTTNPELAYSSATVTPISSAITPRASSFRTPTVPTIRLPSADLNRTASSSRCQSASTCRLNARRRETEKRILEQSTSGMNTYDNAGSSARLVPAPPPAPKGFITDPQLRKVSSTGPARRNPSGDHTTASDRRDEMDGEEVGQAVKALMEEMVAQGKVRPVPGSNRPQGYSLGEVSSRSAVQNPSASGIFAQKSVVPSTYDRDVDELQADDRFQFFVPNRLIQKRVSHRLDFYRQHSDERKLLSDRVRRYKAIASGNAIKVVDPEWGVVLPTEEDLEERREALEACGGNLLVQYREMREKKFKELRISPRDGPTWMAKNAERQNHHKSTASRVWREELAHKKSVVARTEELTVVAQEKRRANGPEERRRQAQLSIAASEWETLVAMTVRGQTFVKTAFLYQAFVRLRDMYLIRLGYFRNWYKPTIVLLALKRKRRARQRWRIAIFSARVVATLALRKQATVRIRQFVTHYNDSGLFYNALRAYRRRVLRCQEVVRSFLRYRATRLNLMMLQWDREEEKIRVKLHEQFKSEWNKRQASKHGSVVKSGSGPAISQSQNPPPNPPARSKKSRQADPVMAAAEEEEAIMQQKINSLVMNDPFKFDAPLPFSVKLKAISDEWHVKRQQYVKKELKVRYYTDKLDYEKKLAKWTAFKDDPDRKGPLPPVPLPPKPRRLPLFIPQARIEVLIVETFSKFKEEVMDLRLEAANTVVRQKRLDSEYILQRESAMTSRFGYDLIEKRKFFAKLHRSVFAAPSLKEVVSLKPKAPPTARLSVFIPN